MARDDLIQIKGTIVEALAGGNYRVKGDNGMQFLAKIGGRMRRFHIRVIPGDRVTIAVSAAHRAEAFAACHWLIDRLKETVPIWKREHFRGGVVWIGAQQSSPGRGARARRLRAAR